MSSPVQWLLLVLLLQLAALPISQSSKDESGEKSDCKEGRMFCVRVRDTYKKYGCMHNTVRPLALDGAFCDALHCEPEEFEHEYVTEEQEVTSHINHWQRVRIGERALLQDECVQPNGVALTRKCVVDDYEAAWEPMHSWPKIVCLGKSPSTEAIGMNLTRLHDQIHHGQRRMNDVYRRRETTSLVRRILRQKDRHMQAEDVHMTGEIFGAIAAQQKDAQLSTDMLSICSEIMDSDVGILRQSAAKNSTNSLLRQFEDYMDALPEQLVPVESCGLPVISQVNLASELESGVETMSYADIGVQALMTRNLSVFFVNSKCSHITGLAIYSAAGKALKPSHSGFWYRFLYANESVLALKTEHTLEAATFLSEELWTAVHAAGANYLVFKVYAHDALFVETSLKRRRRPRSKVLSISIPNFTTQLPHPLSFLLHNENHRKPDALARPMDSGCGYWNYSTWLSDGVITSSVTDMLRDPVIICQTMHLTQFSFLLGGSYRINDLGEQVLVAPVHERVLDIISIVGCCLSLIGLLGIWLTAALFKSWRSQASTKVLLHLCLALTLQMIIFVFLNTDHISEELVLSRDYARCVALGAAMQYSILVLFSWMLIIAFLQFQRYVTVIGIERPKHYILKAAIIAWVVPLLPTLLVACIDPKSYVPTAGQLATDTGVCYPSGYGLIFGVVLPVTLIIVANLVIFVYVFYSISHSLGKSMQRAERKLVIKQIRLSVLLFFLLGLSWIFGVFAFMQAGIVFSYLFCLTATLQGLVLFVYFVLLDEANRRSWLELFRPGKIARDSKIRTRELQSMTHNTTSTIESSRSQH